MTVLVEDSLGKARRVRGLEPKHGLSILIESAEPAFSVLMDTGQSQEALLRNMELLDVRPERIGTIFLSHGHYDHTGGLLGILAKIERNIPIVFHPKVLDPKFKMAPGLKYIGSPFKPLDLESFVGLVPAENSVTTTRGVVTTGEIERTTPYEKPQGFWTVEGGRFLEDTMKDEQALILDAGKKGLVVVSGCAHAGIVNTVRHAQKLMGVKKVHAVIGGFHLKDSEREKVKATIDDLTEINPDFVHPCHCTGSKATRHLMQTFREKCRPLGTGDVVEM